MPSEVPSPPDAALLAALFRHGPQAQFLIDGQSGALIDANEAACWLMAMPPADLRAHWPMGPAPTGATPAQLREDYQLVIASAPQSRRQSLAATRGDGTPMRCALVHTALHSSGRWVILASLEDVSAQMTVEANLTSFEAAMDNTTDAIALLDAQTCEYLYANEAARRQHGLTLEEFLAKKPWELRQPGDEAQTRAAYAEVVAAAPRTFTLEATGIRADGSTFPAEMTRRAVQVDGRWLLLSAARDISERKAAQAAIAQQLERLERSNRELEQFAYVVAHELSEPLRMMGSFARLLGKRARGRLAPDEQEFVHYIVGGAHRMQRLINGLLEYSRACRIGRPPALISMDEALDEALANLDAAVTDREALIERAALPRIPADRIAMVRLLQNLVGNALKFSTQVPARVRIDCEATPDAWVFSVSDEGIGIAPLNLERIFNMFQRLHRSDAYPGEGIGLAVCRKIVERHGGRIWAESQPGAGACFRFSIPREREDSAAHAAHP